MLPFHALVHMHVHAVRSCACNVCACVLLCACAMQTWHWLVMHACQQQHGVGLIVRGRQVPANVYNCPGGVYSRPYCSRAIMLSTSSVRISHTRRKQSNLNLHGCVFLTAASPFCAG